MSLDIRYKGGKGCIVLLSGCSRSLNSNDSGIAWGVSTDAAKVCILESCSSVLLKSVLSSESSLASLGVAVMVSLYHSHVRLWFQSPSYLLILIAEAASALLHPLLQFLYLIFPFSGFQAINLQIMSLSHSSLWLTSLLTPEESCAIISKLKITILALIDTVHATLQLEG